MADAPRWRAGFDLVEREVSPRLQALVRSEPFAVAVGIAVQARRRVQLEAARSSRRVLHQLNLPAGSDVNRILSELGQLRQQVRQLREELDRDDRQAGQAEVKVEPSKSTASKGVQHGGSPDRPGRTRGTSTPRR